MSEYDDEFFPGQAADPFHEGPFALYEEYRTRVSIEDYLWWTFGVILLAFFLWNALAFPLLTYPWFQTVTRIVQTVPERWWMVLLVCWTIRGLSTTLWSALFGMAKMHAGIRRDMRTITREVLPLLHGRNPGT